MSAPVHIWTEEELNLLHWQKLQTVARVCLWSLFLIVTCAMGFATVYRVGCDRLIFHLQSLRIYAFQKRDVLTAQILALYVCNLPHPLLQSRRSLGHADLFSPANNKHLLTSLHSQNHPLNYPPNYPPNHPPNYLLSCPPNYLLNHFLNHPLNRLEAHDLPSARFQFSKTPTRCLGKRVSTLLKVQRLVVGLIALWDPTLALAKTRAKAKKRKQLALSSSKARLERALPSPRALQPNKRLRALRP